MITKEQRKKAYDKFKRFIKLRILHANDSPHRIALGVSLGLFVAWTPAFGLHILIALGLSILLRANKFLAVACVWVSNPFTLIFIYYPNYYVGRMVLKSFDSGDGMATDAQVNAMLSQLSPGVFFSRFFEVEFWNGILRWLGLIGPELWVGSLIMGFLIAAVAYVLTFYFVIQHRKKNQRRRFLQY